MSIDKSSNESQSMDMIDRENKTEQSNVYKGILDAENVCGHTPFFVAVIKGHLQMADMLLQNEMSDINQ